MYIQDWDKLFIDWL